LPDFQPGDLNRDAFNELGHRPLGKEINKTKEKAIVS